MACKSWFEKLNTERAHEVKPVPKDMMGMKAGQMMLIATPKIVEHYIRELPKGTKIEMPQLRADIAKQYDADVMCPLTAGIFLRVVTEAANEDYEGGTPVSEITPVWRVIDESAAVIKKLQFDPGYMLDMGQSERG